MTTESPQLPQSQESPRRSLLLVADNFEYLILMSTAFGPKCKELGLVIDTAGSCNAAVEIIENDTEGRVAKVMSEMQLRDGNGARVVDMWIAQGKRPQDIVVRTEGANQSLVMRCQTLGVNTTVSADETLASRQNLMAFLENLPPRGDKPAEAPAKSPAKRPADSRRTKQSVA